MRLRKSSKWLLLAALVACASVFHEFSECEAASSKKGGKKGGKSSMYGGSSSSSSSSSRTKNSRTKGNRKHNSSSSASAANSSSASSSASASFELGDKVSGIIKGFGTSSSSPHYSKVFKKGPGGNSSKSASSRKGSSSKSGGSKGSKSSNKLTIVTPSPVTTTEKQSTTTTTEVPTTIKTITERLTTETAPLRTTRRHKTRVSFGLGHDSGIHSSSWVGLNKNGGLGGPTIKATSKGVAFGEVIGLGSALGGGLGDLADVNDFFVGATKDYRPLERGGLYADGLDLDFAKVFPEDITELPNVPTSSNTGYNPVMMGTSSLNSHINPHNDHPPPPLNYDTFLMKGRMEDLEKKVLEMERTITTMQKNIEVLQQNTQVISKGFNILSGRVNKVTGDQELVTAKVEDYRKSLEDKIEQTEQNVSLALIALQLKTTSDLEEVKMASFEALGNVTILVNNASAQARNPDDESSKMVPQLFDSLVHNVSLKMEDWQRTAKNETQLLAEMVKALAEISQGEKLKLENLSNYSRKEIERLGDMFEKQTVEQSHEWDAVTTKLKALKMEVEERDKKFSGDILDVHQMVRNATKHFEHEVKQVEESLLEQNMAHNMAHENIALKIDELTSTVEQQHLQMRTATSQLDGNQLRRLSGAEANITTLFAANKQFLQQFASMEEMNGLILSKITDLRTVHKNDNATTKKDLFEVQRTLTKMEHDNRVILDRLRDLQNRVDKARQDMYEQIDVGRLGLHTGDLMDTETPRPTEVSVAMQVELGELKDRIVTFEENVAELWRGQKQLKELMEHNGDMVGALQTAHLADHEDVSLQIMEIKIASKMLSEVVRNLSRNVSEFIVNEKHNTKEDQHEYSYGYSNFSSRAGETETNNGKLESGSLTPTPTSQTTLGDCRHLEEDVTSLWELSRNISKAQELFLVKLLEMDMEHERDNKTVRQMLMFVMNRTEDFNLQFVTADERINKILQQFEFTDAEQAKMREELLNIKDRLASVEENNNALWKASKQMEKGQDEIQNNVDNIVLIHKTEAKNLTSDMGVTKQKIDAVSMGLAGVMDRVINLELLMDLESSKERRSSGGNGESHVNSTEITRIKSRLANTERDVQELWKSSEILSFQQQVFNEKVRELQTIHENDTLAATVERMRNQLETQNLANMMGNMSTRVQAVEKYTSPPYESKTIEFEINNWNEALEGGLKNQQVVYENGRLLELPSTWRTFVERSGNFISLYNSLVKAEKPVYNEFTVEILDSDGKVFSTYGPDMHLYKMNEKIGWSSMISMTALQNPSNKLVTNDALRFRLRTKLYPNGKQEDDPEVPAGPSEKQLIQWEISDVASRLKRNIDEDQAFVDLHISKEFQAGHFWGGNTKWKTSLLMREIHSQNYLGLNMELLHVDQNWRELVASYNVTLLDAHNRIVKEFAIATNDFKAVSARHSYFMLVNDVLQVLERGDKMTFKITFDLQARKRSFDVEFIRTKK